MDSGANSTENLQGIGTESTGPSFNNRPSFGSVPSTFGTGAPIFGSVSSFGTGNPVFGTATASFGSMASSSAPSFTHSIPSLFNSTGSGFALSTTPVSNGPNGGGSSADSESSSTFPTFHNASSSLFGNVPSVFGTGFAQGSIAGSSATSSTHSFTGFSNDFATSGINASSNIPVSSAGVSAPAAAALAPQSVTSSTPFGRFTYNTPGFGPAFGPAFPAFCDSSSSISMSIATDGASSSANSGLFSTTSPPLNLPISTFQTSSTAVTTAAPLATIIGSHPFSPTRFVIRRERPSNLYTPTSTNIAPSATQFSVSVSISAPEQAPVSVSVSAPASASAPVSVSVSAPASAPASAPQLCQRCGHIVTAYSPTPGNNGASESEKVNSISAMPAYSDMSHEELRWAVHPSRVNSASGGHQTCMHFA